MEENKEIKVEEVKKENINSDIVKRESQLVIPKNMNDYINNTLLSYQERGLVFPIGYNFSNEVLAGYLKISQDQKLNICDKTSIQNCLLDMATLGLSMSKAQCYPIPYGNTLKLSVSYFGKQAVIRRIKGVNDVRSDVIYKGTEYELLVDEFGNDAIRIIKPCPLEERKDENIIGAWGKVLLDKNIWGTEEYSCIMTTEMIEKAWNQGQTKGSSPAHKNFKSEMSKKSVIGRLCKNFINTCKDNDMLLATFNKVSDDEYYNNKPIIIKEKKLVDL